MAGLVWPDLIRCLRERVGGGDGAALDRAGESGGRRRWPPSLPHSHDVLIVDAPRRDRGIKVL